MPLRSRLFRGDRKLGAAQVSDPAHLVRGTTGSHVNKVQMALFAIDSLPIDPGEFKRQIYGPSTARAVLAYKTRRKIINRAYQSTPDDIVGQMTITRLDEDMAQWEASQRHVDDCSQSGRGTTPLAAKASTLRLAVAVAGSDLEPRDAKARTVTKALDTTGSKPQLGGALRVIFAITERAALEDGFRIERHIQAARDILFEYGIALSPEVKNGFADRIDFAQSLVLEEDVALLRQAWEVVRPGLLPMLRVIVAQGPLNGDHGNTFRGVMVGSNAFRPFVVLNSRVQAPEHNTTLLHEMIHAAYPARIKHDGEAHSVFFDHSALRPGSIEQRMLKEEHARQLGKSFFAIGGR